MSSALGRDEFTAAFARGGRALWVVASAWIGRAEADDLVQEAARVAWQRRDQFTGGDPQPWLSTIVRQLAANWRRKKRPEVRAELPEVVAATIASADWPFDADRAGLSDELAGALAQLSETARACLLLRVVLEYGFADIARMLEINENTAMSHVRRARETLREALAAGAHQQPTARGTR